jgi:hypothetical protein
MNPSLFAPRARSSRSHLHRKLLVAGLTALLAPATFASYTCNGQVSYLGIGPSGNLTMSLGNATPVHVICNVITQDTFAISAPSCKIAYATFLSAKLAGKSMVVYYQENGLTCATLPSWGSVPGAYFIEGPN